MQRADAFVNEHLSDEIDVSSEVVRGITFHVKKSDASRLRIQFREKTSKTIPANKVEAFAWELIGMAETYCTGME